MQVHNDCADISMIDRFRKTTCQEGLVVEKTPLATRLAAQFLNRYSPETTLNGIEPDRRFCFEEQNTAANILKVINPGLAQRFIEEFLGFIS